MELVLGLITAIVANLIKKSVAKYGALWVQATVLLVAFLVAYGWTFWGGYIDWVIWLKIAGIAVGYYEFFIKRFWSNK